LAVDRIAEFVSFTLDHDLQVLLNRRTALALLNRSLARTDDQLVLKWSAESFDKMVTFLTQNDVQVHYAAASQTVGVYAIVRLVGELRRALRDHGPSDLPLAYGRSLASDGDSERKVLPVRPALDMTKIPGASSGHASGAPAVAVEEEMGSARSVHSVADV